MASSSKSSQLIFRQHQQMQQQNHQFQVSHHQQNNHMITFGMMQAPSSSNIPSNFSTRGKEALNMADMDPTLLLYNMDSQEPPQIQDQQREIEDSVIRPPTLSMFPSQPMHEQPPRPPPQPSSQVTNGLGSPSTSGSTRPPSSTELSNPGNNGVSSLPETSNTPKHHSGLTSSSEHESPKTKDPKMLRRLAQNREAARKSRLRKKAYIQQLESSKIRLTQLEHEIQKARSQGLHFGGSDHGLSVAKGNISSDAAVFDMEYERWLEDHNRLMHGLRTAVEENVPENQLSTYVENCLSHYDQVLQLKGMMAKSDVFHIVSGMWRTPAERYFMWLGGFRPSELLKIFLKQIEPLTDQQLFGICGLQQSIQEHEEALNQGMANLHQFVSEMIAADALRSPLNMTDHMNQMIVAANRLSSVETLIKQADHLRRTTLHRLDQILTAHQTARCLLAVNEYFHRLRALSALWSARPRQG